MPTAAPEYAVCRADLSSPPPMRLLIITPAPIEITFCTNKNIVIMGTQVPIAAAAFSENPLITAVFTVLKIIVDAFSKRIGRKSATKDTFPTGVLRENKERSKRVPLFIIFVHNLFFVLKR
jgi:hypothetical protein